MLVRMICDLMAACAAPLLSFVLLTACSTLHAQPDLQPVATVATPAPVAAGFTAKPRWELGIGGGYLQSFDYPGSADPNERGIALPFFIYRSPVLRLGDGGLRAVAIERPRFKVDVSFGGGLSASAEAGGIREGLPDLDFLFEAGPRAQLIFVNRRTADGGRWQVSSSAALRYVVSTDFSSLTGRGVLAELSLNLTRKRIAGSRIDLIGRLKPAWAEDRLHEYWYEVEPQFATEERPAFDAGSGYLGTELFLGAAFRPTPRVRVFAGVGQSFNGGAANVDSPLFEERQSTAFAIGFAWTLAQSEDRVQVVDVEQ